MQHQFSDAEVVVVVVGAFEEYLGEIDPSLAQRPLAGEEFAGTSVEFPGGWGSPECFPISRLYEASS